MRKAVLLMLVLGAGCTGKSLASPNAKAQGQAHRPYQRPALPKVSDLPCFACHDYAKWGEGPGFPHELDPHKEQGHCDKCHAGLGHQAPMTIRRDVCLQCHDEAPGLPPEAKPEPKPEQ